MRYKSDDETAFSDEEKYYQDPETHRYAIVTFCVMMALIMGGLFFCAMAKLAAWVHGP